MTKINVMWYILDWILELQKGIRGKTDEIQIKYGVPLTAI